MSVDDFKEDLEEMETLEQDLRDALHHVPAPQGFTERVMSRVAERDQRPRKPVRRLSLASVRPYGAWWAGIAASLIVAVGGGDALLVRHHRQVKEEAAVQAQ